MEAPRDDADARPAVAVGPRHVELTLDDVACDSEAQHVTLVVKQGAQAEFLPVFKQMTGLTVRSEVDLTGVTLTATLQDVPCDCLLQALADHLGLELDLRRDEVVLVPRD